MPLFDLPAAWLPHLQTEPVTHYRQLYHQYRLGYARGARGEVGDLRKREGSGNFNERKLMKFEISEEKRKKKNEENDEKSEDDSEKNDEFFSDDDSSDVFDKNEFRFFSENRSELFYENDTRAYQLLSKWRIQYRRFRQGQAHGAEGALEVLASQLTKE